MIGLDNKTKTSSTETSLAQRLYSTSMVSYINAVTRHRTYMIHFPSISNGNFQRITFLLSLLFLGICLKWSHCALPHKRWRKFIYLCCIQRCPHIKLYPAGGWDDWWMINSYENLDRSLIEILSQHLPRHEGRRLDSWGSHWDFLLVAKGDWCVQLTTLPPSRADCLDIPGVSI